MLKNSIRQMLRTPVKMGMFLVLVGISAALLTLGVNLFYVSEKTGEETKKAFTTIGTVEQKASGVSMKKTWNPKTMEYEAYSSQKYDKIIPDSVLDIEGISYVHKPKHQPFYMAYTGDYVVRNTHSEVDESWWGIGADSVIVEVTPFEDCVPDHPVKLHFKKTLYGNITDRMLSWVWFWDYENPDPKPLKAGKTYIMALYMDSQLEYMGILDKEKYPKVSAVWVPWLDNQGSQYKKDGTQIEDEEHDGRFYDEVTHGFYETKEGRRWLNIIKGFRIADYSIPVTPTDSTKLLMYFYNGNAGILKGRDITKKEYESGKKVCLIDSKFAANNQLAPGDKLRLPLYYANYSKPACLYYPLWAEKTVAEKIINSDGELYDVFEDGEYEIVGIYQVTGGLDSYTGFEAAKNGVIIPAASVKSSDENNILDYAPMKEYNTIFQIENGTIDEFWKVWNENGTDELEITFYDNGYEGLKQSFENTRRMSFILLGAGVGSALFILTFFCHIFVAKQGIRIALERTLGVTKRQCRMSIIGGILLVVLIGGMMGSAAGAVCTNELSRHLDYKDKYLQTFSANKIAKDEMQTADSILKEKYMNVILPAASGGMLIIMSFGIAYAMEERNLKKEPLKLLAKMKQEQY